MDEPYEPREWRNEASLLLVHFVGPTQKKMFLQGTYAQDRVPPATVIYVYVASVCFIFLAS